MIGNTYLDIAENDLQYLESLIKIKSTFYNQLAVQCQQVAEKFLKGYLDKLCIDEDVSDLLRKHNMKKMAVRLNELKPELKLDTIGLAYLTDFIMMRDIQGMIFIRSQKLSLKNACLLCMIRLTN